LLLPLFEHARDLVHLFGSCHFRQEVEHLEEELVGMVVEHLFYFLRWFVPRWFGLGGGFGDLLDRRGWDSGWDLPSYAAQGGDGHTALGGRDLMENVQELLFELAVFGQGREQPGQAQDVNRICAKSTGDAGAKFQAGVAMTGQNSRHTAR